jgi:PelA/Pel-15E family pectate lyase
MNLHRALPAPIGAVLLVAAVSQAEEDPLRQRALRTMLRAVAFFHGQVSSGGGYVYRYSADLSKREGEGKTGPDTAWVQPPGTPAVGMAYLEAYELTGRTELLAAARDAAQCLVRGQLRSGGWTNQIELAPAARARFAYRVDPPRRRARNTSTLDDDKSQSAIRFLARLDTVLDGQDAPIHDSVSFALEALLAAQFPNGAWPQGFRDPPDPARHPIRQASYPDSWPRQCPGGDYWELYTFNDNAIADTIDTLLLAARLYDAPRYRQAALKAGDFILLAQMPEPQPAWAQQYDFQMHPAWARKFEPPAVSGGESQGVLRILLRLYAETGETRFLRPVPRALDYLRRSQLPDGRLARFYELRTNRPLYFTRQYELTYEASDLPTHYSFQVASQLGRLTARYERLAALPAEELRARQPSDTEWPRRSAVAPERLRAAIDSLDERGAWVEQGRLRYHGRDDDTRRVIESTTFIRNLSLLSRYLAAEPEIPTFSPVGSGPSGAGTTRGNGE